MKLNTTGKAGLVGGVIVALILIFNLLSVIPWEPKGEVARLKAEVEARIADTNARLMRMETDIRDIRNYLLGPRRSGDD